MSAPWLGRTKALASTAMGATFLGLSATAAAAAAGSAKSAAVSSAGPGGALPPCCLPLARWRSRASTAATAFAAAELAVCGDHAAAGDVALVASGAQAGVSVCPPRSPLPLPPNPPLMSMSRSMPRTEPSGGLSSRGRRCACSSPAAVPPSLKLDVVSSPRSSRHMPVLQALAAPATSPLPPAERAGGSLPPPMTAPRVKAPVVMSPMLSRHIPVLQLASPQRLPMSAAADFCSRSAWAAARAFARSLAVGFAFPAPLPLLTLTLGAAVSVFPFLVLFGGGASSEGAPSSLPSRLSVSASAAALVSCGSMKSSSLWTSSPASPRPAISRWSAASSRSSPVGALIACAPDPAPATSFLERSGAASAPSAVPSRPLSCGRRTSSSSPPSSLPLPPLPAEATSPPISRASAAVSRSSPEGAAPFSSTSPAA
mmetsp:Transcript_12512/g.52642  ORF Transcript_12512/g.52642 Transcript_12512/m.52642 type:complete len:428 (-) Transcript_12512:1233-2516(-)